jgi:hypothetical protein
MGFRRASSGTPVVYIGATRQAQGYAEVTGTYHIIFSMGFALQGLD